MGFGLWAEVVLRAAPPAELRGAALTLAADGIAAPRPVFHALALSSFRMGPLVPPPVRRRSMPSTSAWRRRF